MSDWENKLEKDVDNGMNNLVNNPKKTLFKWVIWIFIISAVLTVLTGVYTSVMAPIKGTQEVIQKTFDGDKIMYDYEWFYQQHEDYQGICEKIRTAEISAHQFKEDAGIRENWDYMDKEEMSRLNSVLTGLKFQRDDIIKDYNAKSKMVTRKIFKGTELPETL